MARGRASCRAECEMLPATAKARAARPAGGWCLSSTRHDRRLLGRGLGGTGCALFALPDVASAGHVGQQPGSAFKPHGRHRQACKELSRQALYYSAACTLHWHGSSALRPCAAIVHLGTASDHTISSIWVTALYLRDEHFLRAGSNPKGLNETLTGRLRVHHGLRRKSEGREVKSS